MRREITRLREDLQQLRRKSAGSRAVVHDANWAHVDDPMDSDYDVDYELTEWGRRQMYESKAPVEHIGHRKHRRTHSKNIS